MAAPIFLFGTISANAQESNYYMKIILMTLSAAAITISAAAQQKPTNEGGIILKGGLNLSNISITNNGDIDEANTLASFNAGFIADIRVASVFSIQTGISYTGKGAKSEVYLTNNRDDNYIKTKSNPRYLEVPLNAVFKLPISEGSNFFIGAGPYVAMGIGGKTKGTQKILGIVSEYEKEILFNDDDPTTSAQEDADLYKLRRFDYGVNALAGVEAGNVVLSLNYGHGLAKIGSSENNNNDKNKYRVLGLSLGFKL